MQVLTLNINYYGIKHGLWLARRELIRHAIESARPDIVALQAVESDPAVADGLDQATQLARLLPGYRYVLFEPAQRTPTGGAQGSAFLARVRFATTTYLPLTKLPSSGDEANRILLVARFDLATGPFHVFNAHVSWVTEQARANVAEVLPYINSFQGRGLLVGDFNNTPDADVMQEFGRAGWTDLWNQLHPDQAGFTFESNDPTIRIDYAWANRELKPFARAVERTANGQDASGAQLSDHLGLLVTLDLQL